MALKFLTINLYLFLRKLCSSLIYVDKHEPTNAIYCLLQKLMDKSNKTIKYIDFHNTYISASISEVYFAKPKREVNYFTLNDLVDSCKWEIDSSTKVML